MKIIIEFISANLDVAKHLLVIALGLRSDSHHRYYMIKRVNIFFHFCLSLAISKMKIITLLSVDVSEGSSTKPK